MKTKRPKQDNSKSSNSDSKGKSMSPPPFQLKADESPVQMKLADKDKVVRGGMSAPDNLSANQKKDPRGHISANSSPGADLDALAVSPDPFPNGSISVSTVGDIRNIQNDQGQNMDVQEDANNYNPLHASIVPHNKEISSKEAQSLSQAFTTQPNKWKKK